MELEDQGVVTGGQPQVDEGPQGGDQGQTQNLSPEPNTGKPELSDEEVQKIVDGIKAQHLEELRSQGLIKDQDPEPDSKKGGDPNWDDGFDSWMNNISGQASAKHPIRDGMNKAQAEAQIAKQNAYRTREFAKGFGANIIDAAEKRAEKKLLPQINALSKMLSDITASAYFGANSELTDVVDDYRDLVEGRKPVTTEALNKLIEHGKKLGKNTTVKEKSEFTIVKPRGHARQIEVPTELAHIYTRPEKDEDKANDEYWSRQVGRA